MQFVLTTNNIWGPVQFVLTTNNIWGTVQFVLTTNIIEELPIALGISAHTNIPINFPGSPYKFPIGRPLRFPACAGLVSYTFGSSSSELPLLPDGVQPRQSPWQNRMSVDTASSTLPPTRHSLTDPRQPRQKPHRYRRLPPSSGAEVEPLNSFIRFVVELSRTKVVIATGGIKGGVGGLLCTSAMPAAWQSRMRDTVHKPSVVPAFHMQLAY